MWLLIVALFGLLVPNGLFIYWLFAEFNGFEPILHDRLALGFILDALVALVVLTVYFAKMPPGRLRWPWFVALSIAGGLGFSIPFYWWINTTGAPPRHQDGPGVPSR